MKRVCLAAMAWAALGGGAAAQTWTVESRRDAFTDQQTVHAMVRGRDYSVIVRCRAGLLETYINVGYVGDEAADVRFRFDQGEVRSGVWGASTDRRALFASQPAEVARWMASGGRLAFEYEDFSSTPSRYSVSLTGSSAAIGRVLDACGLPRRDPREANDGLWRRAVQDIEALELDLVGTVQALLNEVGYAAPTHGRRDQATYLALSKFYEEYWSACRAGEALSASCTTWRRVGQDEDYPIEPLDLLVEVERHSTVAEAPASPPARPSPPVTTSPAPHTAVMTDPDWSSRPRLSLSEDMAHGLRQRGILAGTVVLSCSVQPTGRVSGCIVVSESEGVEGLGVGTRAIADVHSAARLTPRQVDLVGSGGRVFFPVSFSLEN